MTRQGDGHTCLAVCPCRNFTDTALGIALVILNSVVDLVSFSSILYSIYPPLFAALLAYSIGGTVGSVWLGKVSQAFPGTQLWVCAGPKQRGMCAHCVMPVQPSVQHATSMSLYWDINSWCCDVTVPTTSLCCVCMSLLLCVYPSVLQSLVGLNFNQEAVEANMRYGLVRVRENAESIAFYGGQANEMMALKEVSSCLAVAAAAAAAAAEGAVAVLCGSRQWHGTNQDQGQRTHGLAAPM